MEKNLAAPVFHAGVDFTEYEDMPYHSVKLKYACADHLYADLQAYDLKSMETWPYPPCPLRFLIHGIRWTRNGAIDYIEKNDLLGKHEILNVTIYKNA